MSIIMENITAVDIRYIIWSICLNFTKKYYTEWILYIFFKFQYCVFEYNDLSQFLNFTTQFQAHVLWNAKRIFKKYAIWFKNRERA